MYVLSFINYIEKIRRYSQRTVSSYRQNLDMFYAWCTDNHYVDITQKVISEYIIYMMGEKKMQPTSINQHLSSIRSYFDYCCRFEGLAVNPAVGIRDVRTPKRLPSVISEAKMNFLIDHLLPCSDFKRMRTRIIILMFYHCGLRCDELTNLTDADVNLSSCCLHVIGKGNKERYIPFGEELADNIRLYLSMRPMRTNCSQFIRTINGDACTSFQIRRICKMALLRIVPEPLAHPHVLRHTFATVLMNHGARIEYVRILMGHASTETTAIYQHVSINYLQKSYRSIFK